MIGYLKIIVVQIVEYKLNEQYISCFQDVELNMRLLLAGKDNYCFTNSVNFHYESVTRNKDVLNQKKLIIDMQKINDIIFSEKINENELFTQKELLKITQNLKSVNLKFKKINISKRKIYWFFGSRQEI